MYPIRQFIPKFYSVREKRIVISSCSCKGKVERMRGVIDAVRKFWSTKIRLIHRKVKGLLLRDPEGIARQDTQNGYKYKKHVREILREVRRCSLCSASTARPLEKGMKACRTQK